MQRLPFVPILIAALMAPGCAGASPARASTVELDAGLDYSLLPSETTTTAYLRVALTAPELDESHRAPVNLGLVIDRSGSMSGQKLEEAKRAAIEAVRRLRPSDAVSLVTYSSGVEVLAPSAPLRAQEGLESAIRRIGSSGNTALFAGLAKGGYEVRKALGPDRVNRLILLSDGLANVGPSSPGELAELGRTLGSEGIAVTTIGLGVGYNEELLDRLAQASDGNHFFAERAEDLARAFDRELGDVLSVAAHDVTVEIQLGPGVRLERALGRPVHQGTDQTAKAELLQLYSRQTKYLLLELEVPAGRVGDRLDVADVRVGYRDLDGERRTLTDRVVAGFTDRISEREESANRRVLGSVARQLATVRNQLALQLRDAGQIDEARALLEENAYYLETQAAALDNRWLAQDAAQNRYDADNLSEEEWEAQRKEMIQQQFEQLRALGYVQ